MIYFDNSATTVIKPQTVADAVYRGLSSGLVGNASRGGHSASRAALEELFKTRIAVAQLFGITNPLNVALTQNATASLNFVLKSLLHKGDHVITSVYEHNSVLRPLYQLDGVAASLINIDTDTGSLCYDTVEALLRPNTKAVVITHASNVTGVVSDIDFFYSFCMRHNLLLIIDASQTAGIFDIDLSAFTQTIVCFTGHKSLYAPQGTGGIIAQGSFDFSPVFSGGSGSHSFSKTHPDCMPDVFEAGTMNVPAFMGLTAGIEYIRNYGTAHIRMKLSNIRAHFLRELERIPLVHIYGNNNTNTYAPLVSFNIGEISSAEVSTRLDEDFDIAVRSGAHCAPKTHEAFDTVQQGMVRASFSHFNTSDEVEKTIQAIQCIAKL